MLEKNENNIHIAKAPQGFSTTIPATRLPKPLTDKGKKAGTPQPNIFETLQHIFTSEQLSSAAEVF